jgi:hypothetical protein
MRSDYLEVLVRRDDAVMLAKRFGEGGGSERGNWTKLKRFSPGALSRWYRERVASWDPSQPSPSDEADLAAAREFFPGVNREAVRAVRRQFAAEQTTEEPAGQKDTLLRPPGHTLALREDRRLRRWSLT